MVEPFSRWFSLFVDNEEHFIHFTERKLVEELNKQLNRILHKRWMVEWMSGLIEESASAIVVPKQEVAPFPLVTF